MFSGLINARWATTLPTVTPLRYPPRAALQGPIKAKIVDNGEVAERSKALAWKASVRVTPYRGFESHPLRHTKQKFSFRGIFVWFGGGKCVDELKNCPGGLVVLADLLMNGQGSIMP